MTASGTPDQNAMLVRDFVNTLDIDAGDDQLDSPTALAAWLRHRGLTANRSATPAELRAALELREGLRAELRGHHNLADGHPRAARQVRLDQLMSDYPLRVTLRTGTPELEAAGRNAHAGLARIVAAVASSHSDRTWHRLKVCAASTCQWAFLDTSRNQSRAWCAMRVCGNRAKTRTYRARHTP
ncbi:MAG: CGNR zinc finger domain-containing protein [Streptosporangiaceae bacterium]